METSIRAVSLCLKNNKKWDDKKKDQFQFLLFPHDNRCWVNRTARCNIHSLWHTPIFCVLCWRTGGWGGGGGGQGYTPRQFICVYLLCFIIYCSKWKIFSIDLQSWECQLRWELTRSPGTRYRNIKTIFPVVSPNCSQLLCRWCSRHGPVVGGA